MANIVETWVKAAKREFETVKSFVTEPKGVFETVDEMVKTIRYANRETLSKLGVTPTGMVGAQGPVRNIIRRLLERLRGGG